MSHIKLKKIKVSSREMGIDSPAFSDGPPMSPPTFRTNDRQMAEIEDWEQDEHYDIMVRVRMAEKSGGDDEPIRGEFEIVAYKVVKETNEDLEEKQAEGLSA